MRRLSLSAIEFARLVGHSSTESLRTVTLKEFASALFDIARYVHGSRYVTHMRFRYGNNTGSLIFECDRAHSSLTLRWSPEPMLGWADRLVWRRESCMRLFIRDSITIFYDARLCVVWHVLSWIRRSS
ncbi:hypothetical protein RAS1_44220 [Phycisphaerae bacterium RAS1]|nr:hypothetical protein RAS1_44220 [Phycisphaerae bacterium RAS1]